MSRIRGMEVTLKVSVDGILRHSLFRHLKDLEITPRDELPESEHLGKDETTLDYIHNGWDLSWTAEQEDADGIELLDELVLRQQQRRPHPAVTITVTYKYRVSTVRNKMVVYRKAVIAPQREGFSGRQEYVEQAWQAKTGKRSTITL